MVKNKTQIKFLIFLTTLFFASLYCDISWSKIVDLDSGKEEYDLRDYIDILPDNGWSIDQVSSPGFQDKFTEPEKDFFPGQYPDGVWMRFKTQNKNSSTNTPINLQIYSPQPRLITLYKRDPSTPDKWNAWQAGDCNPDRTTWKDTSFLSDKIYPGHGLNSFYLYYKTDDGLFTPIKLQNEIKRQSYSKNRILYLGISFGFAFALICYNTFLFLSLRDETYLFYVFSAVSITIYFINMTDFSIEYFDYPGEYAYFLTSLFGNLFLFFSTQFSIYFLRIEQYSKKLYYLLQSISIFSALTLIVTPFISQTIFSNLVCVTGYVAPIFFLLSGYISLRSGFKSAKYYLIAWSLFLVVQSYFALTIMGYITYSYLTPIIYQLSNLLEMSLLSIALAARIKMLTAEKDNAKIEAATKTKVLSSMSHEIRNPIGVISGLNELLGQTDLTQEQREYVALSEETSDHLMGVINDVLDHSKIDAGLMPLEHQDFDFKKLIDLTTKMMTVPANKKGVKLSIDVDKNVPELIKGDNKRIKQIIINLLSNAIKFTEHGFVKFSVKNNSRQGKNKIELLFTIQDTGIGIPQDEIPGLFKSYSQAIKNNSSKYGGTGLGLSISKSLVEMMGGKIWVESHHGQGSTFYFTIQAQKCKAIQPSETRGDQKQDKYIHNSITPKILIADDCKNNQLLFTNMFKGYDLDVNTATNGADAIDILQSEQFDVVLMDLEMPVMNGLEAAKRIRSGDAGNSSSKIPIIALTGNDDEGIRDICLKCGMDTFLVKPVNKDKLLVTVKMYCNIKEKH